MNNPHWPDPFQDAYQPMDVHRLTQMILAEVSRAVDRELRDQGVYDFRVSPRGELMRVGETVETLVGQFDAMRTSHIAYLRQELLDQMLVHPRPIIIPRPVERPAQSTAPPPTADR